MNNQPDFNTNYKKFHKPAPFQLTHKRLEHFYEGAQYLGAGRLFILSRPNGKKQDIWIMPGTDDFNYDAWRALEGLREMGIDTKKVGLNL